MIDNMPGLLLYAVILGAAIGVIFCEWAKGDLVMQKTIIEAGCGHYDAKTGEFVLGVK
jgi:hypothetical protein